jgi:hypothetical protein
VVNGTSGVSNSSGGVGGGSGGSNSNSPHSTTSCHMHVVDNCASMVANNSVSFEQSVASLSTTTSSASAMSGVVSAMEVMSGHASTNSTSGQAMVCMICEDRATGLHYGIITCEGCKVRSRSGSMSVRDLTHSLCLSLVRGSSNEQFRTNGCTRVSQKDSALSLNNSAIGVNIVDFRSAYDREWYWQLSVKTECLVDAIRELFIICIK